MRFREWRLDGVIRVGSVRRRSWLRPAAKRPKAVIVWMPAGTRMGACDGMAHSAQVGREGQGGRPSSARWSFSIPRIGSRSRFQETAEKSGGAAMAH